MLRKSVGEAPITEAVEEAARWLEEFHPRSVVELDYGGLVRLLPDETLAEDDSTELVATGLAGLARGEAEEASAAYDKLVARLARGATVWNAATDRPVYPPSG